MSNGSTSTRFDKIAADLRLSIARSRLLAEAEGRVGAVAALGLIDAAEKALDGLAALRIDQMRDELAASLPALSGGAPHMDDFEELAPELSEGWPTDYSDDLDGFRWAPTWDGPLPLEILADSVPSFEPSDADWRDYADWCDGRPTEADIAAAGLPIG